MSSPEPADQAAEPAETAGAAETAEAGPARRANRRAVAIAGAVAGLLFSALMVGMLVRAGDGTPGEPTTAPGLSPSAAPAGPHAAPGADRRSAAQRAEDTFIGVTAAHLCTVQSTVYEDAKALADAHRREPEYPGLAAEEIQQLRRRLVTDAEFAGRLTRHLQQTCRPGGTG